MRILVFHGYLLHGTGSNVYNASLAAAFVEQGHEVHLVCQDRRPEDLAFVHAVGDWESGSLEVRPLRDDAARCTVYRPDIGGLLPVYVADRYEGIEARPFQDLSEDELEAYIAANVAAVREVAELVRPDCALANHLVMGPAILARALGGEVPYAAKVHGSAMEYTVRPHPRFLPYAREGLEQARTVLVGSRHIAERLWDTVDMPGLPARTRLGPPGVDIARFAPAPDAAAARAGLERLAGSLAREQPPALDDDSHFARDPREARAAVERLLAGDGPIVAYVGKLIVSKGVDLLLAAWPLVVEARPDARLVLVGFGAYRGGVERIVAALSAGDLSELAAVAAAGRALEGGERSELRHLAGFLGSLDGDARGAYAAAARRAGESVALAGRLEHDELADLLPACAAQVVPSTFPEAFGMVAAEGAACAALPIVADHSGLREVARDLARDLPDEARPLLSFELAGNPVRELAARLTSWLAAPDALRATVRERLAAAAQERYSWAGVARVAVAAASSGPDGLPEV